MEARGYQLEIAARAAEILKAHGLVYLAMETRTGKTLTSLLTLKNIGAKNALFVTKKKAIPSILNDFEASVWEYSIRVVNYEQLHNVKGDFDAYVLDEAHTLGAFPKPSLRTKRLKGIVKDKPVIYLSATPTPESLSQIYHQFWVSERSPFRNYNNFYRWAKDFVDIKQIYVYNNTVNDYSHARRDKVMKVIEPLFLTMTQAQAEIDKRVSERILRCDMPDELKNKIIELNKKRVIELEGGEQVVADTAVKLMCKTHQLCSGTIITESGNFVAVSDYKARKIKQVFGDKDIAIFYKYRGERDVLKNVFCDRITEQAAEFLNNGGVFIGQFQSAREGIRLDRAEAIVFYSIDFSYLSYEQAKNRIVSHERDKEALLYWVFGDNDFECMILKTVKSKQDFTTIHYRRLSLFN